MNVIPSIVALVCVCLLAAALLSAEQHAYFPPPESHHGWRKLEAADDIRRVGMDPTKLTDLKEWLLASDNSPLTAAGRRSR
jgi:hypothetical protein